MRRTFSVNSLRRLKRWKLYFDAIYWLASAVKELASSTAELIEIRRKLRKKKRKSRR
jgi:hypothetical protein